MKRKKTKIRYTDEPITAGVVKDFLPPPEALIFREENMKVTLALSKKSVAFFKKKAEKANVGYQAMIRNLLDGYANHYS